MIKEEGFRSMNALQKIRREKCVRSSSNFGK